MESRVSGYKGVEIKGKYIKDIMGKRYPGLCKGWLA